jgi:hypothetical protein
MVALERGAVEARSAFRDDMPQDEAAILRGHGPVLLEIAI